jgi:hypothetical protein
MVAREIREEMEKQSNLFDLGSSEISNEVKDHVILSLV